MTEIENTQVPESGLKYHLKQFGLSAAHGAAYTAGTYLVHGGIYLLSKLSHRKDHRRRIVDHEFTEPAQNHLPTTIKESYPYERNQKYQKTYQSQEEQNDEEANAPN